MREPVPSDLTAGDAEDPRTLQRYDALGRVTSRTDEVGRVTRHDYAVTGQLVAVVDAAGGRTEITDDQRGNKGRERRDGGVDVRQQRPARARAGGPRRAGDLRLRRRRPDDDPH